MRDGRIVEDERRQAADVMRAGDRVRCARASRAAPRLRSSLLLLAMAIGVAAVVVLTSLGEAARRYVRERVRARSARIC